jgi:ketosteroid isomerase-like protein
VHSGWSVLRKKKKGIGVRKRLLLTLAVVALVAISPVLAGHHEAAEFEKLGERWEAAYNNEGAAAVVAMYLEHGMRMPPDMPIAKGREAIQAQIQGGLDAGLAKVDIEMVESMVFGEKAVARGTFKGMDAEGNKITEGKWANVCKWVDGEWKIYYDIWNMDAPAASAE